MYSRRLKNGYFVLEGLNSFGTVFYFYYFYFFMHETFAFGNKANLVLAALNGGTYAVGSWWAGKLAPRLGYFKALKLGFGIMGVALLIGSQLRSPAAQVLVMLVTVVGMCFTWPTLEALVSEGEPPEHVPHMVGVYNVVWAGTGALAYFVGGAVLEKYGMRALFFIPAAINLVQVCLTEWLSRLAINVPVAHAASSSPHLPPPDAPSRAEAKTFLQMAWLANPFAYIGINTVIAVIPGVAGKFGLSTMLAGFVCSVWLFARLAAFAVLWCWRGWHYRFVWMLLAFIGLVASFAGILMSRSLPALIVAQVVFGGSIGLLYYSSLYYSMDASETKSEHGGIHEAVIGLGNLAGPTVGAMSLQALPQYSNSGAIAVSLLLLGGLAGLLAIWRRGHTAG